MKLFRYFFRNIFLKRWLLVFGMVILLFAANYLTFSTVRSIISTYQGYQEMTALHDRNAFVANLDPDSNPDFDSIDIEDTQKIYQYLDQNFDYVLHSDGFVVPLKNKQDMEVQFNYINEAAYQLRDFPLSTGKPLQFEETRKQDHLPVLIGPGLAESYSLGSTIQTINPVTNKPVLLHVQGILKKNIYRSSFYAPNSKHYYNFAVFIPVDSAFIQNAGLDLHVNALMDLVLLDSSEKKMNQLRTLIQQNTGMTFNFYTQQDNYAFFKEYYSSSLMLMSLLSVALLFLVLLLSIWISFVSVRLMIKDITIHLLVGLSYATLRKLFYHYFAILFFINLVVLMSSVAYSRHLFWTTKESAFVTYGFLGLIDIDWVALAAVLVIDIVIGTIIVELTMKKIKQIPISIGVLE